MMKKFATNTILFHFLLILLFLSPSFSQKPTVSHQFGPFNQSYYATLAVLPPATISNGALQITPDSAGNFSLTNRAGRILLNQSFTLWKGPSPTSKTGNQNASFKTSFVFNSYRVNGSLTPGEGVAFLIAPNLSLPTGSEGQYLGLTNAASDGSAGNKIVAVEFDTLKQDFDPDGNHLGLDVNSVHSVKTVSLSDIGIEIAPNDTMYFTVWIEYDSGNQKLSVFMVKQEMEDNRDFVIRPKPDKPVMTADIDLSKFVDQHSYFGFAASTSSFVQLNCVLRWNLTVDVLPGGEEGGRGGDSGQGMKIGLDIGVPALVILLMASAGLVYYLYRRQRASEDHAILGALKSLPGTPREFKFRELKKATNNFDDKHKLGQGGFGIVYRGVLPKENVEIAVKKFLRDNLKGKDDFLSELTIINRLRHKHLVPLLGWCHQNGTLLLVYEYMPNGSLDNHLFCGPQKVPLSWNLRYKIVSGVASALHYLHNEYDQKVVHRDLKASNIMLDADFNARLGDFGLARALENGKTSYAELEGVPGTMGYIAPECLHTGKATRESDVYGFGTVILEVVCGQRPWTKNENFQLLVDWVWWLHRDRRILKAVDESLGNDYSTEEAQRLLLLGLACSHPDAKERPKTQTIVQIISGSVAPPNVPPFKPAFVWSSAVPDSVATRMDTDSNMNSMATSISTGSSWNVGWTPRYESKESNTGGDYISEP